MLSAALAALGGAVIGYRLTNMTTEAEALFSTTNNLQMIIICLIGGVGTHLGAVDRRVHPVRLPGGAADGRPAARSSCWQAVIFSLLIILVVLFLPRGVMLVRGPRAARSSLATVQRAASSRRPRMSRRRSCRSADGDQALWRRDGRPGHQLRRAARRDRRADRAERRGQDHAGQPDHRRLRSRRTGTITFEGTPLGGPAAAPDRPAGHRAHVPGACGRSPT